jgi:hypothetical protein
MEYIYLCWSDIPELVVLSWFLETRKGICETHEDAKQEQSTIPLIYSYFQVYHVHPQQHSVPTASVWSIRSNIYPFSHIPFLVSSYVFIFTSSATVKCCPSFAYISCPVR